ncbi:hypothetical protein EYF80_067039 [Liparis tanakae]|uniref:Uncharacterized protein n=1 Tax=Liparis tanakae TaxID=230148 RepID=A0A4Z2E245_9TELE|nr:hypothetical protein EYF80_067039 [Liparis tanakae]
MYPANAEIEKGGWRRRVIAPLSDAETDRLGLSGADAEERP